MFLHCIATKLSQNNKVTIPLEEDDEEDDEEDKDEGDDDLYELFKNVEYPSKYKIDNIAVNPNMNNWNISDPL